MDDYAKANPENYYYLDVYSTVSFMEKMFVEVDNSRKNYDLLGGWVCNSPLQEEAREDYIVAEDRKDAASEEETAQKEALDSHVLSIAEVLLTDNFYFVAKKNRDVSFMRDYYESIDKKIMLETQETLGEGENPFVVYKVIEQKEK